MLQQSLSSVVSTLNPDWLRSLNVCTQRTDDWGIWGNMQCIRITYCPIKNWILHNPLKITTIFLHFFCNSANNYKNHDRIRIFMNEKHYQAPSFPKPLPSSFWIIATQSLNNSQFIWCISCTAALVWVNTDLVFLSAFKDEVAHKWQTTPLRGDNSLLYVFILFCSDFFCAAFCYTSISVHCTSLP